jgi:murein DD-endopeptidase MepM/ murein hydrolase activator NlpD
MTTPPPLRLSTLVLALVTGLTSITAPVLVGTGSAPSVRTAYGSGSALPAGTDPGTSAGTGPGPPAYAGMESSVGAGSGSAPPAATRPGPASSAGPGPGSARSSPVRPADPGQADPRAGPPGSIPSEPLADPPANGDPPAAGRFGWPLAPPHPVVRAFEAPSSPYGPGHRGIDIGGVTGEPVLAAGAGVVVFAGQLAGRGVVSVDHPNGLRTTYEPVAPTVKAGRRVRAGAVLGRLRPGHAGCPGVCLHWGVRRGAEYLDPLALVASGHVRLLPWEEVG